MPRDLLGATVVLTRRHEDNEALAEALGERGARVLELPCVRVAPLEDPSELASAVAALAPGDLLVVTSRSGVDAVTAVRAPSSIPCPVAAVGETTAEHASRVGLRVRFVASHADGATLARELPLPSGTVLLARSDLAERTLPDILAARGATVRDVVAYRTVAEIAGDPAEVERALERDGVTVVVASPSAVDALGALGPAVLRRASFVAIGPRTARRVRDRVGVTPVVAEAPDAASIARAIPSPREEVRS
ncbi:MAG: uroporphyrinogen-III synthase [Chloroflexota bacterium]|nr:uroporphyrinogen-III synthase [Chloroflexota bacterium]MDE3192560.1 uroporphyrinogen-III synthase [Chloroflexota bacterium]